MLYRVSNLKVLDSLLWFAYFDMYEDLIYEEILLYHFPEFKAEYDKKIETGQSVCAFVLNNENALKVQLFIFIIINSFCCLSLERRTLRMKTMTIKNCYLRDSRQWSSITELTVQCKESGLN